MFKRLTSFSILLFSSLSLEADLPKIKVEEWAKDKRIEKGVALSVDDHGHVYITNTERRKISSLDLRHRREMIKDDLSFETVEDRKAYYHRELNNQTYLTWLEDRNKDGERNWKDLTVQKDAVYKIDSTSKKLQTIDNFHTEVTGIAGGVLALKDQVIVAAEPDIISYKDNNGDGHFDQKKVISTGYSVHIGQGGHNLSGLALGPDGRIYWSLADKGHSVKTKEGKLFHNPNSGGIFRSELDGSNVELFALGVRNAQELAFDDYGNLFSMDNDGDYPGEKERALYITEGSMHGWRLNWQWLKMQDFIKISGLDYYNPWMAEQLFLPDHPTHAAYMTPTIGNFGPGPCGFTKNPGTALSSEYSDSFFMTNRKNEIRVFKFTEAGASFNFSEQKALPGGSRNTGLAIGPDGAIYCSTYEGRGSVFKFDVEPSRRHPLRKETQSILKQSFSKQSDQTLQIWLGHADQRVRIKAQIELTQRGEYGLSIFKDTLENTTGLAQLHAIFGIGMISRKQPEAIAVLSSVWKSKDPEILSLAAKTIGDLGTRSKLFHQHLQKQLHHPSDRVAFFTAIALGHRKNSDDAQQLISLLEQRGSKSPYLRHAAIMGLTGMMKSSELAQLANHSSRTVKLGAIVALRRQKSPEVRAFLNDTDELVLLEAARAIHDDASITEALPNLAKLLKRTEISNEALMRRVINAAFRNGTKGDLTLLSNYISKHNSNSNLLRTAFSSLLWWEKPPVLDAVEGRYRKHDPRDPNLTLEQLRILKPHINANHELQQVLLNGIAVLQKSDWFQFLDLNFTTASNELKKAYLNALGHTGHPKLKETVLLALEPQQPSDIKNEALRFADKANIPLLDTLLIILKDKNNPLQSQAIKQLAALKSPEATTQFSNYIEKYKQGSLNPKIQLELYELAVKQGHKLPKRLSMYEYGGNAKNGKKIYTNHASAQCTRCHLGNSRENSIGPNLAKIGKKQNRSYLVASLIEPNRDVSLGFGMATITTQKGETISGVLMDKKNNRWTLKLLDNSTRTIEEKEIQSKTLSSAMPPMEALLKPSQIRDVVSYLATLK